ncbi:MAG TPA: nucleotidyltransferase family protein [Bdellovibrionota bacterium]|jgi:hypothetical protein|nr:nucleotidyltransferase family protein [Bdellovibrionota bacterium]
MADAVKGFVLKQVAGQGASDPLPSYMADSGAWVRALEYAGSLNAIYPLVYAVQQAPWKDALPHPVRLALAEELRRQQTLTGAIRLEARRVASVLARANVPALLVGDLDLALRFYPDAGLRPVEAVEILVTPETHFEALRALGIEGYRAASAAMAERPGGLRRDHSTPIVYLTLGLGPAGAIQAGEGPELWERSSPGAYAGMAHELRAMAPEDVFVHVIRHAVRERAMDSPVWINDAHFVAENGAGLDWDRVSARISAAGLQAAAWMLLGVAERDRGTAIPDSFRARLRSELGVYRKWRLSRFKGGAESLFASDGPVGLTSRHLA